MTLKEMSSLRAFKRLKATNASRSQRSGPLEGFSLSDSPSNLCLSCFFFLFKSMTYFGSANQPNINKYIYIYINKPWNSYFMRFPVNKLHQIIYVELLSETVEFMTHHFWVHSAPWQHVFNTQQECNSQDQFNRCSHSLTLELSKKRQVSVPSRVL